MSKIIHVPGGTITMAESQAICPYCEHKFPFDFIEKKWTRQEKQFIKIKCSCGKKVGITLDYRGDFVAYDL